MRDQNAAFEQELRQLISRIQAISEKSPDARDVTPDLHRLVALAESAPECRDTAVAVFLDLLRPREAWLPLSAPGDVEILEFSMHHLQFESVREALESLETSAQDWRVKRAAHRVLEAYEDPWEAGDIYGL